MEIRLFRGLSECLANRNIIFRLYRFSFHKPIKSRLARGRLYLPLTTYKRDVYKRQVCGSGLKCVNDAATMIMAGEADIVVAGGMENMSMAPYAMTKARFGYRMNNATIIDTMVNDCLLYTSRCV